MFQAFTTLHLEAVSALWLVFTAILVSSEGRKGALQRSSGHSHDSHCYGTTLRDTVNEELVQGAFRTTRTTTD